MNGRLGASERNLGPVKRTPEKTRQKGRLSPEREKLAWMTRAPVIWAEKANDRQEVGDRRLKPVTTTAKWTLKHQREIN
jgi:hypothetical protein